MTTTLTRPAVRRLPVVDPATEAKIEAYHRGLESYSDDVPLQTPELSAHDREIGRELDFDLTNAIMQGAI